MSKQLLAWLIIIAAFAAIGLLIDYWRIRRTHPEAFRFTQEDHEATESEETISGRPQYWEPGNLDGRNPGEMDRPHWSN